MNEMEKLILENQGLIGKVIKDVQCHIADDEDYQEIHDAGMLGLILGAKTYNGSTKPSTYLYVCIKREILKVFQYRTRKKIIPRNEIVSLYSAISKDDEESEIIDIIPSTVSTEEDTFKKIEQDDVNRVLKRIPERYERLLRELYGIGCIQKTKQELQKKYNISKQELSNRTTRAMKHFKNEWRKIYGDN